ncbi:MAG: hypothetical protein KAT37_02280 [Candidatus Aenigmarchaeota archaeon]|nr:hypothetical protein [Candidatus Aenigmarchaeota archaeon]
MVKTLEVERLVKGTKVVLRKEINEGEELATAVKELTSELNEALGVPAIENIASVMPEFPLQEGLTPTPQLTEEMRELPVLVNPPHGYSVTEAIVEILDPNRSIWAKEPRAVREVQERLMNIGVRGINNIQNFDSRARDLLKSGKLRREKIDGIYKYYLVKSD